MTQRLAVLLAVLAIFLAVSAPAVAEFGYLGLWRLIGQNAGTVQLFADLTVAMTLVTSWMLRDSRDCKVAAWPYVLLTVAAGSVGPLGYLIHKQWRKARSGRGNPA